MQRRMLRVAVVLLALLVALVPSLAAAAGSFIGPFNTVDTIASTVPGNGDVNPYGIVVVPRSTGKLVRGDLLISNFNNGGNQQGTGTTIVQIAPNGDMSLFAQIDANKLPGACPGGVGLSTALVALQSGWVIVGSLPTSDGTSATAKAGCLLVLNSRGKVVRTFSGSPINGPWDMTAQDFGQAADLFFTNVLNGTVAAGGSVVNQGTVVRMVLVTPDVSSGRAPFAVATTVIGSGFAEQTDPAALVIGPTGVGLDRFGRLFVADTVNSRVAAIPAALTRTSSAGTGLTVSTGGALNGPLGLTVAPNGDILVANAGDGNIVEVSPFGSQVAVKTVDATGAGTLFGLTVAPNHKGVYFVDDGDNTLKLLH